MGPPVIVSAAVEGLVDEAVVQRLLHHAGGELGAVYGKNGKPALRSRVHGYNHAAQRAPWILLVDLDREEECPAALRKTWLPDAAPRMCFRVAVRAVEAWLLADRESFARFLGISVNRVPREPESLSDPKRVVVELARDSRHRAIREDMVPRAGSGRSVGPAYVMRVIDYVREVWRPDAAAQRAESLRRAIVCVGRLVSE